MAKDLITQDPLDSIQPAQFDVPEMSLPKREFIAPPQAKVSKADLQSAFFAAAQKYDVPFNILMGLAEQESNFDPAAVNDDSGAKGIMQYMDATAESAGIDPFDPVQSIDFAAKQLSDRLKNGYSMDDAVKEHFAGPDRKLWGKKTTAYGNEVLQRAIRFADEFDSQPQSDSQPATTMEQIPLSPLTISGQEEMRNFNGLPPLNKPASSFADEFKKLPKEAELDGVISANKKAVQNILPTFKMELGGFLRSHMDGSDDRNLYFKAVDMGLLDKLQQEGVVTFKDAGGLSDAKEPVFSDGTLVDEATLSGFIRANAGKYFTPEEQAQLAGLKQSDLTKFAEDYVHKAQKEIQPINPDGAAAKYSSMTVGALADMAPMLVTLALTKNPAAAASMMNSQVNSSSYNQAVDDPDHPLSHTQARNYASAQALAEAIPEMWAVGKIMGAGGSLLRRLATSMGVESGQEGVTGAIQAGLDKQTITPDMTWGEARQQIIDSMVVGAAMGPAMHGTMRGAEIVTDKAKNLIQSDGRKIGNILHEDVNNTQFMPYDASQLLDPNHGSVRAAPRHTPITDALSRITAQQQAPTTTVTNEATSEPFDIAQGDTGSVSSPSYNFNTGDDVTVSFGDGEETSAQVENISTDGVMVKVGSDSYLLPHNEISAGTVTLTPAENAADVRARELFNEDAIAEREQEQSDLLSPDEVEAQLWHDKQLTDEHGWDNHEEYFQYEDNGHNENVAAVEPNQPPAVQAHDGGIEARQDRAGRDDTHTEKPMADLRNTEPDTNAVTEPAKPLVKEFIGADGNLKWFGSKPKALEFIAKKGAESTHHVVKNGAKWEIHAIPAPVSDGSNVVSAPEKNESKHTVKLGDQTQQETTTTSVAAESKIINDIAGEQPLIISDSAVTGDQPALNIRQQRAKDRAENTAQDGKTRPTDLPASGEVAQVRSAGAGRVPDNAGMVVADNGAGVSATAQPADTKPALTGAANGDSVIDEIEREDNQFAYRSVKQAIDDGFITISQANDLISRATEVAKTQRDRSLAGEYIEEFITRARGEPFNYASTISDVELGKTVARGEEFTEFSPSFISGRVGKPVLSASSSAEAKSPVPASETKPALTEIPQVLGDDGKHGLKSVSDRSAVLKQIHGAIEQAEDTSPVAEIKPESAPDALNSDRVEKKSNPEKKAATVSENKIFTEDAAEKARQLLRSKLGQLNSGIDPEILQAGIMLSGYHIEKGARTFAAYAQSMLADLGEIARPYLKSWYLGVKFDPRAATFEGMDGAGHVESFDLSGVGSNEIRNEPTQTTSATSDRTLAGVSTEPVQETKGQRDTQSGSPTSSRDDAGRNGDTGRAGDASGSGMGDGARTVPIQTGRSRIQRRSTGQSGSQTESRSQSNDEPTVAESKSESVAAAKVATDSATDYRITADTRLGEGGQKTKFKNNIEAIRLLNSLSDHNWQSLASDQDVLARYVGWGGLAQAFDENNASWTKEYQELKNLLTPDEWAEAKESTQYAHYTANKVITGMYDALNHLGFSGGRIIEAGAGVGNFIGLMPEHMRGNSRFTAVERERIAGGIAKALYPNQNVQLQDFRSFNAPDGHFDAAIGNPPFSSTTLTDMSGRKHLSGLSIHNYFFAKNVDLLREGGVMAMVVSNSFMDAKGDKARRYIGERTKLLGAIRLPNNAFAKNANTEVTTDIVFLQKLPESEWAGRAAKEDAKRWMGLTYIADPLGGEDIPINQYFADNTHMMLGIMSRSGSMYRKDAPTLTAIDGANIADQMSKAIQSLPKGVYQSAAKANTAALVDSQITALHDHATVSVGGHYLNDGKLFVRLEDIAGEGRSIAVTATTKISEKRDLGAKGLDKIKSLVGIRNTLRDLLSAELSNDSNMETLRKSLNQQYDTFVKEHGLINSRATVQAFGDDPDFPLVASLEHNYDAGIGAAAAKAQGIKSVAAKASKSPIFTERVIQSHQEITSADSPQDALMISIAERGQIDAGYIGDLLGRDGREVLDELTRGDKPSLFIDPATNGYVLRDAYLSGNVRKKYKQAKAAGMFKNVAELEAVLPTDIPAHEISAKVGSPWVPESVYEDFAKHLFGDGTSAKVVYVPALSSYVAHFKAGSDVHNRNTFGTSKIDGTDILSSLLNSKEIKVGSYVKDAQGNQTFVLDKEGTDEANDKAREIKDKFEDWLFADAERSDNMQRAYNDAVNNYVTRKYDGSMIKFIGKVPDSILKMRRHQRNAVARITQDGRALLDHVVGAGKTFTVIASAMELKRTGLAKKPMIAVPNHLVKQWAADFYRLYPSANILTATKKDFERANRRKFLAKIATGNWDAVIIAHSSFGFIKPDAEFEQKFNRDRVTEIVEAIAALKEAGGSEASRTIKQLAKMEESLENKLAALRDKPMDDLLDFGQLGVDQLYVDEAHMFKNLMYVTKMQNVRGLGNAKGSQKAYDMFIKTHQLYEKNGGGRGVVLATGTPISNSLAEMYHMLRYLAPETLKDSGQFTFDAWAKTYADIEQVWMQSLSGNGYKSTNRMSKFVNTPELLKVFDQIADTVTIEDIKQAYAEENNGKEFPIPRLKGGRRTPVSIPISAEQSDYMAEIADRAKEMENRKGKPEKGADNMLSIMGDARKAAMDIRLVRKDIIERDPNGRIAMTANNIYDRYQKYNAVNGTQLVFSDMGMPKKQAEKALKEYNELTEQAAPLQDEAIRAMADLGDEAAISQLDKAEVAQAKIDANGADWLSAIEDAKRGFSIYDDLRKALVEKGIPEYEVAFIHDYNTDDQKAALFKSVNEGRVRVLLGSTAKMGAGTNVQERLVAEHHMDVPWKPSDIEQREGRIIRQGNKLLNEIPDFEVEVMAYATQDTLDLFMWQTQEKKLAMINQLREGGMGREVDDAFEDLQLSAGEMQAAATSNPFLMEEIQIKDKIKRLERQKKSFDGQKNDLINRKRKAEKELATLPDRIATAKTYEREANAIIEANDRYFNSLTATVNGVTIKGADEIRAAVKDAIHQSPEVEKDGKKTRQVSVDINGKTYTSKSGAAEAILKTIGDSSKVTLQTADGTTVHRSGDFANAMAGVIANLTNKPQMVGHIGKFDIDVSSHQEHMMVDLSLNGKEVGGYSQYIGKADGSSLMSVARSIPSSVLRQVDNLIGSVDYLNAEKARYERSLNEVSGTSLDGAWSGDADLKAARERHKEILRKLSEKDASDENKYSLGSNHSGMNTKTQLRADPLLRQLVDGGKVVFHDSPDTLPTQRTDKANIQALTTPDGMIHMVNGIANPQAVLLHEVFHSGGESLLGTPKWTNLMDRLGRLYEANKNSTGFFADVAGKVSAAGITNSQIAKEEFGAYAVEHFATAPDGVKKWVQSVVGSVQAYLLKRFGVQVGSVSAGQLHALAKSVIKTVGINNATAPTEHEIEGWFSRQLTNRMPQLLKTAPLDRLIDEIGRNIPALQTYLKLKRSMDTYRNQKHTAYDAIAQRWLSFAVKHPNHANTLAYVMHRSTIDQVDPTKNYESSVNEHDLDVALNQVGGKAAREAAERIAEDKKRQADYGDVKALYATLPNEAKDLYRTVRDAYIAQTKEVDQIILANMEKAMDVQANRAVRKHAERLQQISDDGLKGDEKDEAIAKADKALKTAQTKAKFNKAARMLKMRQAFESNRLKGPYFPLSRFGDFFVTVRDSSGEVINFSRFNDAKSQQTFAAEMAKEKGYAVEKGYMYEHDKIRKAVDAGFVADIEDIMSEAGAPTEVMDQVWQRYLDTLPDLNIRKKFKHRKGREGYHADALKAFSSHMFHAAHQMGRMKFSMDMTETLEQAKHEAQKDKKQTRSQMLVNEIERRNQYVMNPVGAAWAQRLTGAAFFWYLGLNPASALVNVSQTVIIGAPVLGAAYGKNGVTIALAEIAKASKDFAMGKGHIANANVSADEHAAMNHAYEIGLIDKTQGHDLAGVGENGVEYNALRNRAMGYVSSMFHQAERFNREVTFLAAYRMAKRKGMTGEAAHEWAGNLTWKSHFDYANTNRPSFMHGDVAKVLLVFRNYQVNMLFRLFRDLHQATSGETKELRQEALKQFGAITGMMALNAGVKGVWLVGIAKVIASLFFGDDDPEEELTKGMYKYLPATLASIALNGVVGTAFGIDVTNRIGMPDLWFRSPDKELEGKEEYAFYLAQVAGAIPAIGQSWLQGYKMAKDGNVERGIETAAPVFIRNAMKTARYAMEGATTMNGDPIIQTDYKDVIRQALGFTPMKVTERYETNNAAMNKQTRIADEKSALVNRWVKAKIAKDADALAEVKAEIKQFTANNRDTPIKMQTLMNALRGTKRAHKETQGGLRLRGRLGKRIREDAAPEYFNEED